MGALSRFARRFGVEAFSSKADRERLDTEAEKTAEDWSARLSELESAGVHTEPTPITAVVPAVLAGDLPSGLWRVRTRAAREGGSGVRIAGRRPHSSEPLRFEQVTFEAGGIHAVAEVKVAGRPEQPRRTLQIPPRSTTIVRGASTTSRRI